MSIVVCEKLQKRFGRRLVLKDISLVLEEGKYYALVGSNGAGKSTLIRLLMRFLVPSGGTGSVLGESLLQDTGAVNDQIGYVSEDLGFRLPMTIGAFGALNQKSVARFDFTLFQKTLEGLLLSPSLRYGELSRGQKMRFFFALALARRPRLILLDEVGSVLDAAGRAFLNLQLAEAAKNGATVLLATNIPGEVQPAVDQVIVLKHGAIDKQVALQTFGDTHLKLRFPGGAMLPSGVGLPSSLSSDGSYSYIVSSKETYPSAVADRRALTTEEMVAYLMSEATR